MARIPDVTSLGQRQTPKMTFSQPRVRAQEVTGYSQALGAVGKELTDYANEEQEKVDKFNYLKARTDLDKKHNEAILAIESEPDYKKHEKIYQSIMEPTKKAMLPTLKGKYQEQFGLDFEGAYSDGLTKVKINTQRKFFEEKESQGMEMIDHEINRGIASSDPNVQIESQNRMLEIVDTMSLSPEKRRKVISVIKEEIPKRRLSIASDEKVKSILDRFDADGNYTKGGDIFDNVPADELYSSAISRQRELKTLNAQNRTVARYNLEKNKADHFASAENGLPLEKTLTIDDFNASYEQPEIAIAEYDDYKDNLEHSKDMHSIELMPTKDRVEYLESRKPKNENESSREMTQYKRLVASSNEVQKMINSDPVSYAESKKLFSDVQIMPIEIGKDNTQTFAQRQIIAERMNKDFGVPAKNLLKDSEAKMFENIISNSDESSAISLVTSLGAQMTGVQKSMVAKQIAEKGQGLIANILATDPQTATLMIKGSRYESAVSKDKFWASASDKLSSVSIEPRSFEAMKESVYSAYKGITLNTGATSKEIDQEALDKAIELSVGKVIEVDPTFSANNSRIISWRDAEGKFVSAGKIENALASLNEDDFSTYANGLPRDARNNNLTINDLLDNATLKSSGMGKVYFVLPMLGDVITNTGEPFELNLKKLIEEKKILNKVNPLRMD